jgi:hypothetical protein
MVSLLRLAYCFLGIDPALQLSSILFCFGSRRSQVQILSPREKVLELIGG